MARVYRLSGVERFYRDHLGLAAGEITVDSSELPALRLLLHDTAEHGSPWTAVTSGMSARRMNLPAAAVDRPCRAELVSYLPARTHEFTWWLGWLAEFPFIDDTWLGHGHTVYSQQPLFSGSALQHFLILPPLVRTHRDMESEVNVEGDSVALWWVVPITDAEREFKRSNGLDALLDLFDSTGLPMVVDPARRSVA
ncbi:MAG TPA: suppressor of fused domain protein [Candidatus Paceibacterota bacterium]|nr:suppressor of fused domain protein [Candidatus Paceibacterota bacterium]